MECCRDELGQPTRRVGSEAPGLHGHQRGGQALAAAGAGAALATYACPHQGIDASRLLHSAVHIQLWPRPQPASHA